MKIRGIVRRLAGRVGRYVAGTITHVSTEEPVVALTFDDGPHPLYTPRLLKVLEAYDARATFFMIGKVAEEYPELVRFVVEGGHEIGNHTWDHEPFSMLRSRERRRQLRACERVLAPYGSKLFRPPYGDQTVASRLDACLLGYRVIAWDLIVGDWQGEDKQTLVDRMLERINPGSIVVLHDRLYTHLDEQYLDRTPTIEAVDVLLSKLSSTHRFVTVSELLEYGRPRRENWYRRTGHGPSHEWLKTLKRSSHIVAEQHV